MAANGAEVGGYDLRVGIAATGVCKCPLSAQHYVHRGDGRWSGTRKVEMCAVDLWLQSDGNERGGCDKSRVALVSQGGTASVCTHLLHCQRVFSLDEHNYLTAQHDRRDTNMYDSECEGVSSFVLLYV